MRALNGKYFWSSEAREITVIRALRPDSMRPKATSWAEAPG